MCCFLGGQSRWCRRENLSVFLALTWSNFQNLLPNVLLPLFSPEVYTLQQMTGPVFSPHLEAFVHPSPRSAVTVKPSGASLVLNSTWGWKRRSKWKHLFCTLGYLRKVQLHLYFRRSAGGQGHFTPRSSKCVAQTEPEISDLGVKNIDGKLCSELLTSFSYKAKIKAE